MFWFRLASRLHLNIACIVFTLSAVDAQTPKDNAIHEIARESIVKLKVSGTASIGDKPNRDVDGQGTGFLISEDGHILTTAHLFKKLKETFAVNTKIEAEKVFGFENNIKVLFISEVASLDLVLLRAFPPPGKKLPRFLEVGSSEDVNVYKDRLLSSGFTENTFVPEFFRFGKKSSELVPFAWEISGNVVGTQSGSPVYIKRNDKPLVVGVVKASSKDDDNITLMTPVENSFQLIGYLKMREMQTEIKKLKQRKIVFDEEIEARLKEKALMGEDEMPITADKASCVIIGISGVFNEMGDMVTLETEEKTNNYVFKGSDGEWGDLKVRIQCVSSGTSSGKEH